MVNVPVGNPHSAENRFHSAQSASTTTNNSSSPEAVFIDTSPAVPPAETKLASSESDVLRMHSVFKRICRLIEKCATPTTHSKKWDFLQPSNSLLQIDMSPRELATSLQQHFTSAELSACGINAPCLAELLTSGGLSSGARVYVAIDQGQGTVKLTRAHESPNRRTRTALDYCLERNRPGSSGVTKDLLVVDSGDSARIMESLGLQAVDCAGLEALNGIDIARILRADEADNLGWRYFLVLFDFNVARIDRRPTSAIGKVISRLADALDIYRFDPARRFSVFQPSAHEFRMLERATAFADPAPVARIFRGWVEASRRILINSWRTQFDRRPVGYARASAELARALQLPDVARRFAVSDALRAYQAAGQTIVVKKFWKAVEVSTDPFDQLNLIAAAAYAEEFFAADALVLAAKAVLNGNNPPPLQQLQAEIFSQRQRIQTELRRIRRDQTQKR